MNLRSVDLNLLVILDALMQERSVRRAAERVGLSQSAMSHALDRLRKVIDDELFVRSASGMEPTPRALQLAGPLRLALQDIRSALAPDRFDPAASRDVVVLAVETYETIVVLPQLVDEIRQEAPGLELSVQSGSVNEILSGIDQGRIDLAIGLFSGLPDRFMTCRLLSDDHVAVLSANHPLAGAALTLDGYLGVPHLLVSMSGASTDVVDDVLMEGDRRRRIVMRLPHGLAAITALARSDMIATVTRGAARIFAQTAPLVLRELPFDVPATVFRLVWSRRLHNSPANIWLRRKLVAIGASAATERPSSASPLPEPLAAV